MTVFLVLIPRMDKRIDCTDLCMHARSPFPLTCSDTLDLCTLSCLCGSNRPDLCEVYAILLFLMLLVRATSFHVFISIHAHSFIMPIWYIFNYLLDIGSLVCIVSVPE